MTLRFLQYLRIAFRQDKMRHLVIFSDLKHALEHLTSKLSKAD